MGRLPFFMPSKMAYCDLTSFPGILDLKKDILIDNVQQNFKPLWLFRHMHPSQGITLHLGIFVCFPRKGKVNRNGKQRVL